MPRLDPSQPDLSISDVERRRIEQMLFRDPEVQAILRGPGSASEKNARITYLMNTRGTPLPSGHRVNERGQLDYVQVQESPRWLDPRVIGPIAVGAAGGLAGLFGAPAAAGSGGAGAAAGAGAGVLPSSQIPTSLAMHAPGAASTIGGGVGGAMSGAGVLDRVLNGVGTATNTLANSGGLLDRILDWAPTALAGVQAGRNLFQGPPQAQVDLERILKLAEGRINATQPLFDQLNTFTQARMPDFARGRNG